MRWTLSIRRTYEILKKTTMLLTGWRADDCLCSHDAVETPRRPDMFQDSLSEGAVYYGRMLAVIGVAMVLAYLFANL
jgi:hypothetical protein